MYVYRCPQCPARVSLSVDAAPTCGQCSAPMGRVPEGHKVLLDIDAPGSAPVTLIPARVDALHAAGVLLPETQAALDWMWHRRKHNGMEGAFLLVGGRRCIDLDAFVRLMREQRT